MFKEGDIVRVTPGYPNDDYLVEVKRVDETTFKGTVTKVNMTSDPVHVKVGYTYDHFTLHAFELDPDSLTESRIDNLLTELNKLEEACLKKET